MDIKAAFFDIDGTLLPFGRKELSPGVREALRKLRARGIRTFIATGRPPYLVPRFAGVEWDGMICFNGAFCRLGAETIYADPMDKGAVRRIIANAEGMGLPVNIATGTRMGCNFFQPELDEYIRFANCPSEVLSDFPAILEEDVFQMMVAIRPGQEEALFAGVPTLKPERWWPKAIDIVAIDCGKDVGLLQMAAHLGLGRENLIAFGDGGNDEGMIRTAGIGVAMGNARDEVKEAADLVTETAEADGVCAALRRLGLMEG